MKPQYFIAALFGVSLYWIYLLYQPFLLSMTIAALLAISTSNIQNLFERYLPSKFLATFITTLLFALLFFGPFVYVLVMLSSKLHSLDMGKLLHLEEFVINSLKNPPEYLAFITPYLGDLNLESITKSIVTLTTKIGVFSAGFVKNAFLIIVFYFFANYYGSSIISFLKRVVQMKENESTLLAKELSSVMSVVFFSILVTAAFEGALFGIAVSFLGYNGLLYGILFGFASLVPVVGAALMWVPFMVYELFLGHSAEAIFIALYTIVVISIIADTFIKPLIIKEINLKLLKNEKAQLDSLVIFFAIIAGLATFGFWGMILGPAITAFFLSILKLFEARTKECEEHEHHLDELAMQIRKS